MKTRLVEDEPFDCGGCHQQKAYGIGYGYWDSSPERYICLACIYGRVTKPGYEVLGVLS